MRNALNKNSWMFVLSQSISLLGSSLVEFAIIWYVTLKTNSGSLMAIGLICVYLPRFIISFFAGVWADRYNRKKLVILSDLFIAVITLLLSVFFLLGYEYLWMIFIALALRSIGTGIQTPTITAIIPMIVEKDKIARITGINNSFQSLITIISPLLSGALLSLIPLGYIFLIDVLTAIIAVWIVSKIKIPLINKISKKVNSFYEDFKSVFIFSKENAFVKLILISFFLFMFLTVPLSYLSPLLIVRHFGEEVWKLTVNEISLSIGTLIGGVIISFYNNKFSISNIIFISCLILGLLTTFLTFSPFYVFLLLMLLSGICISLFTSNITIGIQKTIEVNMQGRIMSLLQMGVTVSIPLGVLFWGPMCDIIAIDYVFISVGLILFLVSIAFYHFKKKYSKELEAGL